MTQRPQRGVPSGWSSQQRPQPRIPGHQTRPELPGPLQGSLRDPMGAHHWPC